MWARWRGPLGLRGRILGVVLVTSVATLAVAAVTLLGPLEQSLRNAEKATLKQELAGQRAVGLFTTRQFDPGKVVYAEIKPPSPSAPSQGTGGASISPTSKTNAREEAEQYKEGVTVRDALIKSEQGLESALGASEVVLLGYPDASGQGSQIVVVAPSLDVARQDPRDDVGGVSHAEAAVQLGIDRRDGGRQGGHPVHHARLEPGPPRPLGFGRSQATGHGE